MIKPCASARAGQEVDKQLCNEMGVLSMPARACLRYDTQVAERERSGQRGAGAAVGDVSLASDHQHRSLYPLGEGFEIDWAHLIQEPSDVGRAAPELLDKCRRKQAENAIEDGSSHDGLQTGVRAQHECCDPITVSTGNLQRHHGSPPMTDKHR